jgi:hypothetical protein
MLETSETKLTKKFDSCVVEVPREFALANGFPEKCFVTLTLRNGKLESEIIKYSDADEKEVDEFLNDYPNLNEEFKKVDQIKH